MEWHERLYYEEISPAPPSSSFSSEDGRAVEPASSLTRPAPAPPFSSSLSSEDGERGVELLLERQAEALLASRSRKRQERSSDNEESKKIDKRYACTICGKRFPTPSKLQRHTRVHTGEKPFLCVECGTCFSEQGSLKKHMRIHTGEKPFLCVECDVRFSRQGSLKEHMRIHTGEKPFLCVMCGTGFSQQGNLKNHMRTHTGEKPYKCPECSHASSSASNLKVHLAGHEISKSWKIVCSYAEYATDPTQEGLPCQRQFSRPIALDYHIQASHTVEGLRRRLESENQMARFFESNGICFLRDWQNAIIHANCPQLALPGRLSRPDFFLPELSVPLGARVIVENDEFAHRGYPSECELSRILKITSALSAEEDQQASRYVFIRFNPHFYTKNGVRFDPSLETRQKALLQLFADLRSGAVPTQDDGLTLIYLFYDQIEGRLCFFKNSDSQLSTIYEERSIIYV